MTHTAAVAPPLSRNTSREVLVVSCSAHALHDGLTDVLYLLLPIWQTTFGLDYAAVGALRALAAGTMAGMQVPASWLARRIGGAAVLAGGTAVVGLAYLTAGASNGLTTLALALVVAGFGLSTQHPIASSLVARAYAGERSRVALGTYNFAGDIGKMAVPTVTAWLIALSAWRPAVSTLGVVGCVAAIAIALRLRSVGRDVPAAPAARPAPAALASEEHAASEPLMKRGFRVLLSIGIIDSATRMAFLTFLPFLLRAKGAELPAVGMALTLVFAGGAAGKFVCGFLGQRLGVMATVYLTEGFTAAGILALLPLPLAADLVLLPLIGVALNGTSSVIYGTVPELTPPHRREHAFGLFYTGTIGAGAVSPVIYGLFGDAVGVPVAMSIIAAVVLLTLPLAAVLRRSLPRV